MTEPLLVAAWVAWCVLHSLLANTRVRRWLEERVPGLTRRYRLGYNLVALVSLLPLALWEVQRPQGSPILSWHGSWVLLQGLAWVAAAALAWGGARAYSLREFVGLAGFAGAGERLPPLVTGGVLGLVRHPWYLAGLLVLWARSLDRSGLVTALVLSLYLLVGSRLEEGRLERLYGSAYREYRQRVSGLLPIKYVLGHWPRRR